MNWNGGKIWAQNEKKVISWSLSVAYDSSHTFCFDTCWGGCCGWSFLSDGGKSITCNWQIQVADFLWIRCADVAGVVGHRWRAHWGLGALCFWVRLEHKMFWAMLFTMIGSWIWSVDKDGGSWLASSSFNGIRYIFPFPFLCGYCSSLHWHLGNLADAFIQSDLQ